MFEGKLVRLRAVTKDDLPRFVTWINDQDVVHYLDFYRPISVEDEERWFSAVANSPSGHLFAVDTIDGRHVGSVGLHRVSLHVYEHNPRAVRCYEKCGFVAEGRLRQAGFKEGKYFDILVMGILDDEFRRRHSEA
ncbi:MAG: GNAT family N-acetyltransferase [Anaerolineae bacterium]